jgi:serine/threonine protein kinase
VPKLTKDLILNQRYRLIRCLGEGGMATVWLATDMKLEVHVALKFLHKTSEGNLNYHRALKREWEIASHLIHPNIIRVYEFHEDSVSPFYSMQFIDGPAISILCKEDLKNILPVISLIADALDYAHSREVIHGDIKAHNILLDKKGQPFLLDFGVAATFSEHASTMNQETPSKDDYFSKDIDSLGKLIYEIIYGRPPLIDGNSIATFDEELSAELKILLERMIGLNSDIQVSAKEVKDYITEIGYAAGNANLNDVTNEEIIHVEPISVDEFKLNSEALSEEKREVTGISKRNFYISLVFILIIFFIVIFVLPSSINSNKNIESSAAYKNNITENIEIENESLIIETRLRADEALGKLVSMIDSLQERGIEKWGGLAYQDIKNNYKAGDSLYLNGRYEAAQEKYVDALNMLSEQTNEILMQNLNAGKKALKNDNFNDAIKFFDITVSLSPNNTEYSEYYRRALNLEELIDLKSQGLELENNMDLSLARERYKAARELDLENESVRELLNNIDAKITRNNFEISMSEGFIALTNNDFQSARALFGSAKEIDAKSTEPIDAIIQLEEQEKDISISVLEAASKDHENMEQWGLAIDTYLRLLEIDGDLQFAKSGLIRSKLRQRFSDEVQKYIDDYDILSDPITMKRATNLLLEAVKLEDKPRLRNQISELKRLLKRANTPIKITLISDNITKVTIFRISKLEVFNVKQLSLRPGNYIAIGIRDGYRDVREEFRVAPEIPTSVITVICEEKI